MLSNRPYILRAFYEWIVDSQCTPILMVHPHHPRCRVPQQVLSDEEALFNISPAATRHLKMTNEAVEFKISIDSVVHLVNIPIQAVLALYADENNEGIFFDKEEEEGTVIPEVPAREMSASVNATNGSSKPFLTLVE